MTNDGNTQILSGIRVVDFTIWAFGPVATQLLGDFGADVIKVEPLGGESGRGVGMGHPQYKSMSVRFMSRNRNKRSICVDLTTDEGRNIVFDLMRNADVVVSNFRPGVVERLGISYEVVRKVNPEVIYVTGSGYGSSGPYSARGGQDRAIQALSGFMSANGDPGHPPTNSRVSIMDISGGMVMAQGILLALINRMRTGSGQKVDLSLLDVGISSNAEGLSTYLNTGQLLRQCFDPLMRAYPTSDGYLQIVTVFARSRNPMAELSNAIGRPELADDPRFADSENLRVHEEELTQILEKVFAERTTADWIEVFDRAGIICAPVHDYASVVEDPQVRYNDIITTSMHSTLGEMGMVGQPLRLSATPATIRLAPPLPGEHTDEVLREQGYDEVTIRSWREREVIA